MLRVMGLITIGLVLAGCETAVQTTSGEAYLARYNEPDYAASIGGTAQMQALNDEIRAIAAVEPSLRFPARIGIARIEHRRLTALPPAELLHWADLGETLGDGFGEFVPVSPMIAAMVDPQPAQRDYAYTRGHRLGPAPAELIAHIRRGAARQHLDYVLIYELSGGFDQSSNLLSAADATVLGYFLLPSREVQIRGAANALLLDVRNGYPYGTAAVSVEDRDLARGSTARERGEAGVARLKTEAVASLTGEIEVMVHDLQRALITGAEGGETISP